MSKRQFSVRNSPDANDDDPMMSTITTLQDLFPSWTRTQEEVLQ